MTEIINENDNYPFYFVAFNDIVNPAIIHYGKANEGQRISTGQPSIEVYEDEELWIDRINDLKGIPNWYQDNN